MRPIVTDRVVWCGLSVCLSVTDLPEPIEVPFGLRTWVGPKNHVLDGGPDLRMGRGNFEGKGRPIVNYRDTEVSYAKTALN